MQKLLLSADKLFKYLVAAIILAVPLYPKFPFINIPGTYVAIRLEDFLLLLFAIFVVVKLLPRIRDYFRRNVERAILIYLSVGLISLLSAVFLLHTVPMALGTLHWIRRIEYFMPFLAGGFLFKKKDEKLIGFIIKLFIIVILVTFVYGVGQRYLGWPLIITQNEEYSKGIALRWVPGSHINAGFAGHYDLASFVVMIIPIFVVLMALFNKKIAKIGMFLIYLMGLWLISASVSRISAVSFVLSSAVALLIVKKYKEIIALTLISLVFFSLSGQLIMRFSTIEKVLFGSSRNLVYAAAEQTIERRPTDFVATPTPIPILEDRSTSIRLNVEWPRAIRAFSKNPLLGTGYSSITLATDNDYLRLLGETGLLGFLAFVLIFLRIGEIILKSLPLRFSGEYEKAFVAGFLGSLPGLFLNATFIDIFEASKFAILFWLLMGIFVSQLRLNNNEQ